MGTQFKGPLQGMGTQPTYSPNQQRSNAFQNREQPFTQQPAGNTLSRIGQPFASTAQGFGDTSTNPFQRRVQPSINTLAGMGQPSADFWQNTAHGQAWSEQQSMASAPSISGWKESGQKQTHQKNRRISKFVYAVLVAVALLLVLSGGGYWYYQANAAAPLPTSTDGNHVPTTSHKVTSGQSGDQKNDGMFSRLQPQAYSGPGMAPMSISAQDGLIIVSISQQQLTVYDKGKVVYFSLVTTGMPQLYTPTGTFHVIGKATNRYFGPPAGASYTYAPEHINYAVQLTTGGIYIHDSAWRSVYGPGTNLPHNDPQFGQETGSHGCINTPYDVAKWLYLSIAMGTTVEVVA